MILLWQLKKFWCTVENLLMSEERVGLSIVIACYNEEKVLEKSVGTIQETLDNTLYDYEIILVDDGSTDETFEIARGLSNRCSNIKLIWHKKNMGRGRAVADGIRFSQGRIAGFIDVDLETHARYIPFLALEIDKGADIATAWRIYKVRLGSFCRWLLSLGYRTLSSFMLETRMKDTETGCKFFNREKILPIIEEIQDEHWFWDTEVMVRSYYRGLKIREIPTLYIRRKETGTTVKVFKDTLYYLARLWRFRKEVRQLKYASKALHTKSLV